MAESDLSPAKALLLAVQLGTRSDLSTLRTLVAKYPQTLHTDIVLRILLTHLPESLSPSEYVPFLQDLVGGNLVDKSSSAIDASFLEELSDEAARKRVRKLNLLPLSGPKALEDTPSDSLVKFLIHRSMRIDECTGLIPQIPELLAPFLHHSAYLRAWMISSILPLLRLNYEYYPQDSATISIPEFQRLDDRAGLSMLLSRTGDTEMGENIVGRDLKGLVGPWMYGGNRAKRRRLRRGSGFGGAKRVGPLDESPCTASERYACWEEVFKWITNQATTSWQTAAQAVEQWDGPGDIDAGEYEDGSEYLDEDDQQHLERRYARAAMACAYSMTDESMETLLGARRILGKLHVLLDLDRIPTLEVAGALLTPVSGVDGILSSTNAAYVRNDLLDERNVLTTPNEKSCRFLHAVLVSSFLIQRAGVRMSIRRVAQLVLLQDEVEQNFEFGRFKAMINGKSNLSDDKYWIRVRNELLWLRNWGAEEVEGADNAHGRGFFGKLSKESIEVSVLRGMLTNNRIPLARNLYETSSDLLISREVLAQTVISEAFNAYDNATNANKTRGGLKRCQDILWAFPDTLEDSWEAKQLRHLIPLTHSLGKYRLVFKQGEPFKPVTLRVHPDPIVIIEKVLSQNSDSYLKINDLVDIALEMVMAGLTSRDENGAIISEEMTPKQVKERSLTVNKRTVSDCIDAALAEDDFETAYSYVMTRLATIAGPAQERSPQHECKGGLFAEPPPKIIDDYSWRAALQAGKYRLNPQTKKPKQIADVDANPELRHLEQRMECLSHAVRLAPKSTLQEILNVFRRCEEELEALSKLEAEKEAEWDAQGDEQAMPGGFGATPQKLSATKSIPRYEEAPMSLFDLSKGAVARAQTGLGSLSMLNRNGTPKVPQGDDRTGTPDSQVPRERKRDQLSKAAVGTFAAGVGWLVGAPTPTAGREDH